jgi:hypothetical protein
MVAAWVRGPVSRWEGLVGWVERTRALRSQRAEAMDTLAGVLRVNDLTLAREVRGQCDEYAADVLGSRWHAPWLYVYAALQGRFREGWIPPSYLGQWVAPWSTGGLRGMTATKSMTRRILGTDALPDLGYVIAGRYYDRDFQPVDAAGFLAALRREHERVVVKRDGQYRGYGVRRMTVDELAAADPSSLGPCVIQSWVQQHPDLERVTPDASAAYRIVTARELDGTIGMRGGIVKFGQPGDGIVSGASKLMVGVVDDIGTLADTAHDEDWRVCTAHPATGVSVTGWVLPAYPEAVRLCTSLHASVPHLGVVGWDVTVDEAGRVRVLEWNAGHIGVSYSESTIGPSFIGLGWEDLHRVGTRPIS